VNYSHLLRLTNSPGWNPGLAVIGKEFYICLHNGSQSERKRAEVHE